MPSISKRTTSSPKIASTVAALAAAALLLVGCSGGDTGGADVYQEAGSGWNFVRIDGDTVQLIDGDRGSIADAVDDIESGDIPENPDDASYDLTIGTLNDAEDTVIWEDGDDDPISVADDMITLDGDTYLDFDAEQSVAEREDALNQEDE